MSQQSDHTKNAVVSSELFATDDMKSRLLGIESQWIFFFFFSKKWCTIVHSLK